MKKDRSLFSKVIIVLIAIILIFALVKSIKHNINVNTIDDYQKSIVKYTEVLDKYAYGDYEKQYNKIKDESDKAVVTKKVDKIDELKNKYKSLTEKVKAQAPSEIEGYYNEVSAIDLSVLSDEDKNTVGKDIVYLRTLIDKKFYRVSYNETVRIKKKVKKAEEKQKKALEDAQKKAEEEAKKNNEKNKTNTGKVTTGDTSQNNTVNNNTANTDAGNANNAQPNDASQNANNNDNANNGNASGAQDNTAAQTANTTSGDNSGDNTSGGTAVNTENTQPQQ